MQTDSLLLDDVRERDPLAVLRDVFGYDAFRGKRKPDFIERPRARG
jgi:hypothetical protein